MQKNSLQVGYANLRKEQFLQRNATKNALLSFVAGWSFAKMVNIQDLKEKEGVKTLFLGLSENLTPLSIYEMASPLLSASKNNPEREPAMLKLIGFLIKNHLDSIENTRKMSEFEIFECCILILEKFCNEKFDDLVLAFKQDKLAGTKYWVGFGSQEVFALLNAYFEGKALAEEQFRSREQSQHKQQIKTSDFLQSVVSSDNPIAQKMKKNIKDMSNCYRNPFLPDKMPNLNNELATLKESVCGADIEDLQQLHASCLVIGLKAQTEIIANELKRRQNNA